jgi:NitT/TauT family transport system permease protein
VLLFDLRAKTPSERPALVRAQRGESSQQLGVDSFLFSSPSSIWKLLWSYLKSLELFKHVGISVLETVLGLIIGTLAGLIFAVVLWWNKIVARIVDPFLVVLNALPKTALAPILIIWAGTGIKGITSVAISISLVLTILSAYSYFNQIEEDKIKMLKSFKATKWQILTKLVLPSNFPNIINIIKINIGMSWVGVIVGEFIVSRNGLGYLITYGTQVFRLDLVMMGVLVLAIIAFVMYEIVNLIEKYFKSRRS